MYCFTRFFLFISPLVLAAQVPQPPAPKPVTPQSAPAPAAFPADKVVMSVGGENITAGELERIIEALPEQFRVQARGPNRRQFAENIVRVRVLAQEARKKKLDQTPAFQAQLAFQRDNLLAGAAYQDLTTNLKVDEAALRQYYDQHKAEYENVRARHILVRMKGSPVPAKPGQPELSEEEALAKAQELRKKLGGGADFAETAKAESDDVGSAANGGDLGQFGHNSMVPPFEQAAFALPVGQLSEPVKTQFGYHLIKVEAHQTKAFDEVKGEIEKRMRPELAQKRVEDMRKQAVVTLDEQYFGPPAPPAAVVAQPRP